MLAERGVPAPGDEVFRRLRDEIEVERAFAQLDLLWRSHGLTALSSLYVVGTTSANVDQRELEAVLSRIRRFVADRTCAEWVAAWMSAGAEHLDEARIAVRRGDLQRAALEFQVAVASYFVAAACDPDCSDDGIRDEARERAMAAQEESFARLYRRTLPRVPLAFADYMLPGW